MKLTFLGTRGYIDERSDTHHRHSSLLIEHDAYRVLVDCGEDWLGEVHDIDPDTILITHAHPDHVGGLADGAPCPVYGTVDTWENVDDFDLQEVKTISEREPFEIGPLSAEAFPVDHSTRAPAVGFRISNQNASLFYVPDVVYIHDRAEALRGIELYVGDGSTLTESMVRQIGDALVGHTPVRTQLTWCQKEGVDRALFTHCGSRVVRASSDEVDRTLHELASERGVEAAIAVDGQEEVLG